MKSELLKIKQEKEEFEAANYRQRSRIMSQQTEIDKLRNERDSIQQKYKFAQV